MDKKPIKPTKLTFKDKIKMLFCARTPDGQDSQPVVYRKSVERRTNPIKKQQRQTLNINDVFLKLSRKNIVQQEFFSNDVLNLQLEKHIASRIKHCTVGLIKGQFTEQSTQTLKIPIYLTEKPTKTIPYREQIKSDTFIKIRKDFVDVLLFQTTQTCTPSTKKSKFKSHLISNDYGTQININTDKQVEEQFKQIKSLLIKHTGLVENIVIVCSKEIDLLDWNKQLMEFTKEYLFELERVRENQELVCNIMYISRNAAFLKLQDKGFKEFMIGEMEMTLEEEGRMSEILTKLMSQKYYREIVNTVRALKRQKFTTRSLFEPFIIKISEDNEHIRKLISQMKSLIFIEQSYQYTPELVEPTPMFLNKVNVDISYCYDLIMIGVQRILRYFSGFHTDRISKLMQEYKPQSQQNIIETLKKIDTRKQYMQSSPITEAFVGKIEYFLLAKKQNLTAQTLYIYQMLKQLDILTPRFKYGILKNLSKSMQKIIDNNLSIKNNQLEVLLWFIYREYPLLRDTKFQQIASDHSLKLYQMYQFMNTTKNVPTWSPFLRISTMMQALGHDIETRKDMSMANLDTLDYLYYPFLINIFKTHKDCIEFREKNQLYEPFLIHLCNRYIDRDKYSYDKYLQYVERIDNEETQEQVEKVIDPLNWYNFIELFELYTKSCEYTQLDTRLSYNVSELFWRLCQSKNVELESCIRFMQILAENPFVMDENVEKMLMRTRDAIQTYQAHYFKFLPGRGFLLALSSIDKLPRASDMFKAELSSIFLKNIPEAFSWEQGEKSQLYQFLQDNKIEMKQNVRNFLQNKQ